MPQRRDCPHSARSCPARQLAGALDDAMARTTRLERGRPARLQDFTAHDDHVALNLRVGDDERHLRTRLLVAADGTDSVIRNRLNMPLQRRLRPDGHRHRHRSRARPRWLRIRTLHRQRPDCAAAAGSPSCRSGDDTDDRAGRRGTRDVG
ncbi:MAG: FAD-dependent monooxygenase [Xanthomonadales bacterium]|nr:FAD-dependent monooxygenase [Xanthomonadales bacterium]